MRRHWPWLVVVALAVWGAWSYASRVEFEKRARSAERFASERVKAVAALDGVIARLAATSVRRDTVILERAKEVRRVDATNPPPDTCRANLAVRDSLIADQGAQLDNFREQIALAAEARRFLQASHDTLAAALAARPKGLLFRLPFLEIGKPALGPFVGVCQGGHTCIGLGVVVPIRIGG